MAVNAYYGDDDNDADDDNDNLVGLSTCLQLLNNLLNIGDGT